MLTLLRDLTQHKWTANAGLLKAIGQHQVSSQDEELRKLLHHILIANRFWLFLSMGREFSAEQESIVPGSLKAVAASYRETYADESRWISSLDEAGLTRKLQTSHFPGCDFSVEEVLMQVCMHSHGHRAQCATRLRLLGGTPPAMDFIVWLKERPAPDWS